jgi:hypothetical protein
MSDSTFITRLKISSIVENNDGTSTLIFDLDDEFIEWFKKREGLKRFSHKRFQKVIAEAIGNYAKKEDKSFSGVIGNIVLEEST